MYTLLFYKNLLFNAMQGLGGQLLSGLIYLVVGPVFWYDNTNEKYYFNHFHNKPVTWKERINLSKDDVFFFPLNMEDETSDSR